MLLVIPSTCNLLVLHTSQGVETPLMHVTPLKKGAPIPGPLTNLPYDWLVIEADDNVCFPPHILNVHCMSLFLKGCFLQ